MATLMAAGAAASAGTAAAGTASAVMAGISAAATAAAALSSYQQGQDQKNAYKAQAAQVELSNRMAALSIQEDLIQTMATNNVSGAVGGLKSSGSIARAKEQSMANAEKQLDINRFKTDSTKGVLESQGNQAATQGLLAGAMGVVKAGTTAGNYVKAKKKIG